MTWHNAFELIDMDDWRELNSTLQAGWNVNERNDMGETLIHRAAQRGLEDCLRVLIEHKADLDAADMHGATALMKAVIANRNDSVETLVKSGADIHAKTRGGKEAVDYAADGSMAKIYLLQKAADITASFEAAAAAKRKGEEGFATGLDTRLQVKKPLQIHPK